MTARVKRLRGICFGLWSLIIFPKWPDKCPICKKRKAGEAHHLLRKENWRHLCCWDKRNGIAICQPCHKYTKRVEAWLKKNHPEQYHWFEQQRYKIRTGSVPMMNEEQQILFLKEIQKNLLKQQL